MPLRGSCHAEQQRSIAEAIEMVYHPSIGAGGAVVGLIAYNGGKVSAKLGEAVWTAEGLDAGEHDRGRDFIALGFDNADVQGGIDEREFFSGLGDQLIPVSQNERTALTLTDKMAEDHRFAGAGGQSNERASDSTGLCGLNGIDGFPLVWTEGEGFRYTRIVHEPMLLLCGK